jgi:hypothetical protein
VPRRGQSSLGMAGSLAIESTLSKIAISSLVTPSVLKCKSF